MKTGSSSGTAGISDMSEGGSGGRQVEPGGFRRGSVEISEGELSEVVGGGGGDDGWEITAHDAGSADGGKADCRYDWQASQ